MYCKNKENKPYFEPSKEIIERDGLVEVTKEEFDKIVYEINNPPITEEQRILSIKNKAQSFILEKYSLEKQLSAQLGIYGEAYLEKMKTFISNIIRISNEAEAKEIALEDIKWEN